MTNIIENNSEEQFLEDFIESYPTLCSTFSTEELRVTYIEREDMESVLRNDKNIDIILFTQLGRFLSSYKRLIVRVIQQRKKITASDKFFFISLMDDLYRESQEE